MTTALNIESEIEEIMKRPYLRELTPEEDGTWFAHIVEFPGCMTVGDTQAEALEMLEDAARGWLETHLEDGDPIPEPIDTRDFSGKFNVRVTKSLHRDLVKRAETEGVSLNQYVSTALATAVGRRGA
jgi:antitoxin HicB